MKNIHVISTDKPSRLILQTNGVLRLSEITFKGQIASGVTQNIYITNSEEIKEEIEILHKDLQEVKITNQYIKPRLMRIDGYLKGLYKQFKNK